MVGFGALEFWWRKFRDNLKIFNMKTFLTTFAAFMITFRSFGQGYPWKKEQVMSTAVLAAKIQSEKDLPLILNVGPMDNIKTAVRIGAANTEDGIGKLKATVAGMDRKRQAVIYCGCCTYSNCPNIRPAFEALTDMGVKNVMVLNIPEGVNWRQVLPPDGTINSFMGLLRSDQGIGTRNDGSESLSYQSKIQLLLHHVRAEDFYFYFISQGKFAL